MNDVEMRNVELQVANGHLRDAFNAYQHFSQKSNVFSTFASGATIAKKVNARSKCIEIATLIAVTYAEMGAGSNAKQWRDEAWRQFAIYEQGYRRIAMDSSSTRNPHNRIFIPSVFQEKLQKLESERVQLDQIFQAKGIA